MKELIIKDKNDKVLKYEILTSFHMATTGKDYVVYTDNTKDENEERLKV